MKRTSSIKFDRADLELFATASHDLNPLHLSEAYAHTTAFGECVVYGVLGGLAAFGGLAERPRTSLASIKMECRKPLLLGIEYRVEIDEPGDDRARISVYDAERLMTTIGLAFQPADAAEDQWTSPPVAAQSEPADLHLAQIATGFVVNGAYSPSSADVARLVARWRLAGKGFGSSQLAALLWASYVVGMQVPGRRGLFWSLEMSFDAPLSGCASALSYHGQVVKTDTQFEFVEVSAELSGQQGAFASGKLRAFVRRDSPVSSPPTLRALLPAPPRLDGKTALVVGGSRGLGAALVQALAMQGASVIATYRRSISEAEQVVRSVADAPGTVELLRGDVLDARWCADVLTAELGQRDGLDILICNAAPGIYPLGLSPQELDRFADFTAHSLAMFSQPMAAALPALAKQSGCVVLISSSAVTELPTEWPHYVAAKAAAEGLARWAAMRYPNIRFLIVRPPRLLTDQTNTAASRVVALPVEQAAARIVTHLGDAPIDTARGSVEVLEKF